MTSRRDSRASMAGRTAYDATMDLLKAPTCSAEIAASIASTNAVGAYIAGYDYALAEHRITLVAAALTGGHGPADAVRIADETIRAMKESDR